MDNKKFLIIGGLLIVLLIGAIFYNNSKVKTEEDQNRNQAIEDEVQRSKTTLNVKHQYVNGSHRFLGTVDLPTPCHTMNATVKKNENETVIEITTKQEGEVCAQTVTPRQFLVTFEGKEDENVIATLNGDLVNLNIFEVGPDEVLEDVDIYIKG